jgi:hypothetical protein
MKYNTLLLLSLFILLLTGCKNRIVDQLRPETVEFLEHQEKARCSCLQEHGENFIQKMDDGITLMKGLPDSYDLNNLSPRDVTTIRAGLSGFEGTMRMLMPCIQQRTQQKYQSDQLTQMLIAEDFRVVLQLDSAKTDQEKMERMNAPTMEVMREICPDQVPIVLKMQEFLEVAQILPPELQ